MKDTKYNFGGTWNISRMLKIQEKMKHEQEECSYLKLHSTQSPFWTLDNFMILLWVPVILTWNCWILMSKPATWKERKLQYLLSISINQPVWNLNKDTSKKVIPIYLHFLLQEKDLPFRCLYLLILNLGNIFIYWPRDFVFEPATERYVSKSFVDKID